MIIAAYVFFALSIITSIIHLLFCFLEMETLRKCTKVFCVSFLALSLIFYVPYYPLIYVGAIFGAIGDYFLIHKEKPKSLALGIAAFFMGHVLYGIEILTMINTPTWGFVMFYVLEIALELALIVILTPRMKYTFHSATIPGIAYFTMLGTNLGLSVLAIIFSGFVGPILLCAGYAIFITSDIILLTTAYIKSVKRADFYIMITYILAQLLIGIGLVIMVLGI